MTRFRGSDSEGGGHLRGRSAVVTGSNRGIGRAVALALAAEGAGVVVNGRGSPEVDVVVAEIRERGGAAVASSGSVADCDFAGELIESCVDAFGAIDVLVNCAGVAEPDASSILDIPPQAWREVIDVHLSGSFYCCRHAVPRMVERRRGSIINTSSHAFLGTYGGTAYPAAKGATNSLTFAMAADLSEHGVRVNAVCPGAKTRLSTGPAYERRIRDLHARGLLDETARDASLAPPDPRFVGPMYAFLASDLADGITGRLFGARGGSLTSYDAGGMSLLAHRDEDAEGPWNLEEIARRIRDSSGL
jgi:NAD(P)-dependent dehydrogenase (short-subunit alcohol dehydrogenase family)